MSKRPFPFDDDYQRQNKMHVTDMMVNQRNPTAMSAVYGKIII